MASRKTLWIALGIAGSFTGLAALTLLLLTLKVLNFATTLLILIAMIGLYIGFGFLFAVWRLVSRLE